MAKLIINKPMGKTLSEAYRNYFISPGHTLINRDETVVKGSMTGISNVMRNSYSTSGGAGTTPLYVVTNGAGVAMLNLINDKCISGVISNGLNINWFAQNIGNGKYPYYVHRYLGLTEDEIVPVDKFVPTNFKLGTNLSSVYDEENSILGIVSSKPMTLRTRFNRENGEDIYLVSFMYNFDLYSGTVTTGGKLLPSRRMYSSRQDKLLWQLPFIAMSISTVEEGTGDIQFDHTDQIDIIDNFEIQLKLPREYS